MSEQNFNIQYRPATKWDKLWIDTAQRYSEESKDLSTKVGCVIVKGDIPISQGWNGFPRGVDETIQSRLERPAKYDWVIHAEMNAILNHARNGGPGLAGSILVLNYRPGVCSRCMGALAQVGITDVIGPSTPFPGKGRGQHYDIDIAHEIADETQIRVWVVDYEPARRQ